MTIRSKAQIEADLTKVLANIKAHNRNMHEGDQSMATPFDAEHRALIAEHKEAVKAVHAAEWTKENTQKRRAAFNAEIIKRGGRIVFRQQVEIERKLGYRKEDLVAAIKQHAL